MKKLKQFKPLWNLIKEDKVKLIIASIFIFITELSTILTGYLNGSAVEAITNLALKSALIYLLIYLFIEIVFDSFISTIQIRVRSSSLFPGGKSLRGFVMIFFIPNMAQQWMSSSQDICILKEPSPEIRIRQLRR